MIPPDLFLTLATGGPFLRQRISAGVRDWWRDLAYRQQIGVEHIRYDTPQRERHVNARDGASSPWYIVADDDIVIVDSLRHGATWTAHVDAMFAAHPTLGMARPILFPGDPESFVNALPSTGVVLRWGPPSPHTGQRPMIGPIGGLRFVRRGAVPADLPPQVGTRYDATLCAAIEAHGFTVGILPGLIAHDLGWRLSVIGG